MSRVRKEDFDKQFKDVMTPGSKESDKSVLDDKPKDLKDEKKDVKEEIKKEKSGRKKKVKTIVDPFDAMVIEFKKFCEEYKPMRPLNLSFDEQKPGNINVYQGQKDVTWVWLKNTGCKFVRISPLRIILNLPDEHPLKKYFRNYNLMTGEKHLDTYIG